ncbi:MAG TPA: redoxin domain-containing protein [Myxococcales bacterium]|jgi:cytochrome c biogenesis protein CcmG/thiol:disulfide interchange protein DsbE|nr:redoxin domain-containing protein [Myxococcales bacterium]
MRTWISIAGLGALALMVVLARAFGTDPHAVPFGLRGQPAPAFSVTDLRTGAAVTSEQLRGQPFVLNFWASWCSPCKVEHPTVEWGARAFGDRVRFFGVVFEDTPENAREDLARRGSAIPQLLDPHSRMAVDYGTTGVPETYFIDASGIIVDKFVGPIDPESLRHYVDLIAPARAEARP